MNLSQIYVEFEHSDGSTELVSLTSILEGGTPIDPDTEDDLEFDSSNLFDSSGNPLKISK
jgi:hypothetical protein